MTVPSELTPTVLEVIEAHETVSGLVVLRGASLRPPGDVVIADITREAVDDVVAPLYFAGIADHGTIQIQPVPTWISRSGFEAERRDPGSAPDALVWPEVTQRAYEDSELNWTFLSFLTMATTLAAIGIILDSQILTIGAMVLGPEFGAVAALAVALVRRRPALLGLALRTLVVGFVAAIAITTALTLLARAAGWLSPTDLTGPRPETAFIYTPDRWSIVVAVIAASAGVLSITANRVGGMAGVFISVTTVPAAGNIALGLAFASWTQVRGSLAQLLVNLVSMAVAGAVTLLLRHVLWHRFSLRVRYFPRLDERARGMR